MDKTIISCSKDGAPCYPGQLEVSKYTCSPRSSPIAGDQSSIKTQGEINGPLSPGIEGPLPHHSLADSALAADSLPAAVMQSHQKGCGKTSTDSYYTQLPSSSASGVNLDGQPEPKSAKEEKKDGNKEDSRPIYTSVLPKMISKGQLILEVQENFNGLVEIEKECIKIHKQLRHSHTALSKEHWNALTGLHRTLLQIHHDFYLASSHPLAIKRVRELASEHNMPLRLWEHSIHPYLELLRCRLPCSYEYMVSYLHLAYDMMILLLESVPKFKKVWREALGHLANYGMIVEQPNHGDWVVWTRVARHWYQLAADKVPDSGRIQRYIAKLAGPDILRQLFYYTKSLVCVEPFAKSWEDLLLLFNSILKERPPQKQQRQTPIYQHTLEYFFSARGIIFKRLSILSFFQNALDFFTTLPQYIGHVGSEFRQQGVYISSLNIAALLINKSPLTTSLTKAFNLSQDSGLNSARAYWSNCTSIPSPASILSSIPSSFDVNFATLPLSSRLPFQSSAYLCMHTFSLLLHQIGNQNVLPAIHVYLAFIYTLSLAPKAMHILEPIIPFKEIITFLNTLACQNISMSRLARDNFSISELRDKDHYFPEDLSMRGQVWARLYFPKNCSKGRKITENEHNINLLRAKRCLWLGLQIGYMGRWFAYCAETRCFILTDLALQLESNLERTRFFHTISEVISEAEDNSLAPALKSLFLEPESEEDSLTLALRSLFLEDTHPPRPDYDELRYARQQVARGAVCE